MNSAIKTAIEEALSEVTERKIQGVTGDMRLDRDFDLDSYMFVQFLLALEDKVPNLRFHPEAIGQTEFNTISSLADYVSMQVDLRGAA